MALDLISSSFDDGDLIPEEFGCDGDNVNPPLEIYGVPEEAESLVLLFEDLDGKEGELVHWMVWNINPNTKIIDSGLAPEDSIEGYNDFGAAEYRGPCPDSGEHRYQFRLYALDTELELDEDVTRDKLEKEMAGHILDEVLLVGRYSA